MSDKKEGLLLLFPLRYYPRYEIELHTPFPESDTVFITHSVNGGRKGKKGKGGEKSWGGNRQLQMRVKGEGETKGQE